MVFDNEADKKMVLHVIANFPMSGPYVKVAHATKELDALTRRVEQASIAQATNIPISSKRAK
jgi:hypothetical protein